MIELIKTLRRIYKANISGWSPYSPNISDELSDICEEKGIDAALLYKSEKEFQSIISQSLLDTYITK